MGYTVYSLEDFRRGMHPLFPQHLVLLKQELLQNVRADWKKQRILALTPDIIKRLPYNDAFTRIQFAKDGGTQGGGYVEGQHYASEIKEVVSAFVGKRP